MPSVREWWESLSPNGKALVVASAGTGAVLGGIGLTRALKPAVQALRDGHKNGAKAPKLKCGEARSKGKLIGPDVSKWQGEIDWDKVCFDGVSFAIVKATQDTHIVDSTFERNWDNAKRLGIYRGAYHFGVPPRKDSPYKSQHNPKGGPVEQAEHFYATVGKLSHDKDLPPVLDLEWRGESSAETAEWCREFMVRAEKLFKRTPAIYTTTNFIKNKMGNPYWLRKYIFWQAYWTNASEPPSSIDGLPWTFWQFTNKGDMQGIKGNVDVNRFYGTPEQLAQLARGKVLPPRPAAGVA